MAKRARGLESPPTATTQVEGGEAVVEVKSPMTWSKTEIESEGWNSKDLNAIFNVVTSKQFCRVTNCDTSKEA